MQLVAHRGFDKQYSANTVAAVERAIQNADMVEIDIRRCASGELVVAHNALIDIDIDGIDRVDELTATELAALDAHDGEGVQTLNTVLDMVPAEVGVNLELKDPKITEQVLTVAESVPHEVIISSFDPDALRGVHPKKNTNVELAYVLGATPDDDLAVAMGLDCAFVHPNAWLCLLTGVVARAHDAGLAVNAWTVDSRPGAWALSQRGVDGLIASSPHVVDWVN
ncbi:glycerophosphodiester phosphodiesterase [Haloquadratum walsbyi]|jgi:Glycerophosphoryl diester phosphodiesterase|uniref:Glycerophosphoryl diester phosphodiesterase n=1 Tax=Haloquadratum walsbyi J07HQW2 TaxID=1238425 RepID=U1NA16_9EURY|nr:glycerophosphodiester phosphodiesterase [Haloquadratum walsbyi]ERG93670.1 MAG: glycerophosphoryl diester phosphodiesterase [Haloquadratum walsbyi J07HQW2]